MPVLESSGQHRPVFYHPNNTAAHALQLSVPEKLDYLTPLPLFAEVLDELFEKRPVVTEDGTRHIFDLTVRDALLEHAEFYQVPAGTSVFREGSFGEHLFLILEGNVQTSMHISSDNETHTVQLE